MLGTYNAYRGQLGVLRSVIGLHMGQLEVLRSVIGREPTALIGANLRFSGLS